MINIQQNLPESCSGKPLFFQSPYKTSTPDRVVVSEIDHPAVSQRKQMAHQQETSLFNIRFSRGEVEAGRIPAQTDPFFPALRHMFADDRGEAAEHVHNHSVALPQIGFQNWNIHVFFVEHQNVCAQFAFAEAVQQLPEHLLLVNRHGDIVNQQNPAVLLQPGNGMNERSDSAHRLENTLFCQFGDCAAERVA